MPGNGPARRPALSMTATPSIRISHERATCGRSGRSAHLDVMHGYAVWQVSADGESLIGGLTARLIVRV
jgi:hypothetical protein